MILSAENIDLTENWDQNKKFAGLKKFCSVISVILQKIKLIG